MGAEQRQVAHRALDDHTLVFLHIPKAGGATLRRILFRVYGKDACYWIMPSGNDRRSTMERLKAMGREEKRKLRVITGHFHYGTVDPILEQPTLYVTLLREPAERVRSQYQFVRGVPDHPHHQIAQGSLAEYSAASSPALDNLQTRLLAGALSGDNRQPVDRAVSSGDLERALAHLQSFAAVGVQERFMEAVQAIGRLLSWGELPEVESAHVEQQPIEIDTETRARVTEHNRFDAALHRAARAMQDDLDARVEEQSSAPQGVAPVTGA
jgi:hypothetical protein